MPFLANCEEAHTKTSIHHVITKKKLKIEYTKLYIASLFNNISIQNSNIDKQSETRFKYFSTIQQKRFSEHNTKPHFTITNHLSSERGSSKRRFLAGIFFLSLKWIYQIKT